VFEDAGRYSQAARVDPRRRRNLRPRCADMPSGNRKARSREQRRHAEWSPHPIMPGFA
jgi:hypothetical protein